METDNRLFHYTTLNGLLGILDSQALHLSHIRYMNDDGEFLDFFNDTKELVAEKYVNTHLRKMRRTHRKRFEEITSEEKNYMFTNYLEGLERAVDKFNVFVVSFCKTSDDLLSQWRGYTSETVGYCIEFDTNKIRESVKSMHENSEVVDCDLIDCIYTDEEKEEELKEFYPLLASETSQQSEKALGHFIITCIGAKNSGFSEEDEARIYISKGYDSDHIEFKDKNGIIIPYIPFSLPEGSIKSITVGPCTDQYLAIRSLEMLIENNYEGKIEVRGSNIPLKY